MMMMMGISTTNVNVIGSIGPNLVHHQPQPASTLRKTFSLRFANVNWSVDVDNVAAFIFWGADQAIFGDQAPPKWSHASLIAPSSQFDILIDVVGQLGKASVDVRFWRVRDVSAKVHYLLPVTSTLSIFHSNTDGMLCVRTNIMPHFPEQKLLLTSQWSLHVKDMVCWGQKFKRRSTVCILCTAMKSFLLEIDVKHGEFWYEIPAFLWISSYSVLHVGTGPAQSPPPPPLP